MTRILTPLEKNQLLKHGFDEEDIDWKLNSDTPIEYITGFAEFLGRDFIVNNNTLIPRIETEEIIDLTLKFLLQTTNYELITIADVGTGSGCIGITIYLELQKLNINSKIIFIDISEKALNVAQININKFKIPRENYEIIQSDLLLDLHSRCDLIVANLPYIPTSRLTKLDRSVINFEPVLALDGGVDGLKIINNLLDQLTTKLKSSGFAILEIDSDNKIKNFENFKQNWKISLLKDSFKRNRFLILRPIN